jgi:hypothetical protein
MRLNRHTTKVVSLSPTHGEVYSIQHYVMNVCQWFAASQWFSVDTLVSSINKTDHHDLTEMLLKVTLNTRTLTLHNGFIEISIVEVSIYSVRFNDSQVLCKDIDKPKYTCIEFCWCLLSDLEVFIIQDV